MSFASFINAMTVLRRTPPQIYTVELDFVRRRGKPDEDQPACDVFGVSEDGGKTWRYIGRRVRVKPWDIPLWLWV